MAFSKPLEVYNRALQHIGRIRVGTIDEPSDQAKEITACFDKLRLAELQRNTWRFAIRSARLRPIATTTLQFTPNAWAIGTTYTAGQVVSYVDFFGRTDWWQLYAATSTGDQPDISPKWQHYFGPITLDVFDSSASYDTGELVKGSDTNIYLSLINNNTADPTMAPAGDWVQLAGTTAALFILWPVGVGPIHQVETQNLFRLPFGYLRVAPLAPKQGIGSFLGMPPAQPRLDWTFEGDYFYSSTISPVFMRFVADVADVAKMSPMFCEMWAARIATEVAPTLSEGKDRKDIMANAAAHYSGEAAQARLINAVELGPVFSPIDDYITCRL